MSPSAQQWILLLVLTCFLGTSRAFLPWESPRRVVSRRSAKASSPSPSAQPNDDKDDEGISLPSNLTPQQRTELLKRAAFVNSLHNTKTSCNDRDDLKPTSVGPRRVGSATRTRHSSRASRLRQVARGLAAQKQSRIDNDGNKDGNKDSQWNMQLDAVHGAIQDVLQKSSFSPSWSDVWGTWEKNMGILGDTMEEDSSNDDVTTILTMDNYRCSIAKPSDDLQVANLRLSVFSNFVPELRGQFCDRSCQAIAGRRRRGAVGVVCRGTHQKIVGSAECSYHEFFGTELGRRRLNGALMYVTEVAVSPCSRRKGIGGKLLQAIDRLADDNGIETIYLHVDVTNMAAIRLYEKAGYDLVTSKDTMYEEFTTSLNLHPGATKGREHYLLFKNLTEPTWLPQAVSSEKFNEKMCAPLGFQVPV